MAPLLLFLKEITHLLHPTDVDLLQVPHPATLSGLPPLLLLLFLPLLLCTTFYLVVFVQGAFAGEV